MKAEGRRQKAEGLRNSVAAVQAPTLIDLESEDVCVVTSGKRGYFCPLPSAFCLQERSDVK